MREVADVVRILIEMARSCSNITTVMVRIGGYIDKSTIGEDPQLEAIYSNSFYRITLDLFRKWSVSKEAKVANGRFSNVQLNPVHVNHV